MNTLLKSTDFPRISFGIIVLNGEPFTKYCLRQLYPHAHEIIVVEGASRKAIKEAPEGHSTDGTLEVLNEFKSQEDIENKVTIVTIDGFWSGKDEQSQAYAQLATGDYLWQVDIDEFYRHQDIERIRYLLRASPNITAVSFRQLSIWGSLSYMTDSFALRADNRSEFHRLFKWGSEYKYVTHRPPTVVDQLGNNLRQLNWLDAGKIEKRGIYLFHYSLLFPKQVASKCHYYANWGQGEKGGYFPGADRWFKECYLRLGHPFRVHNNFITVSWLQHYDGKHPEEIEQLWNDIKRKEIVVQMREMTDVQSLLSRRSYFLATKFLTLCANMLRCPLLRLFGKFWRRMSTCLFSRPF